MKELRRAERHKVRFKMVFDDGQTYSAGYVRDISRTGLFLETASPLPVGSEVRLEPVEQTDALFEVSARVVRVAQNDEPMPDAETHVNDGQVGMGLEFLGLDGPAGDAIEKMVDALEAAQLRTASSGNLDPLLGVYVEDAPVGGEIDEMETINIEPPTAVGDDLEDALDSATDDDLAAGETERDGHR